MRAITERLALRLAATAYRNSFLLLNLYLVRVHARSVMGTVTIRLVFR